MNGELELASHIRKLLAFAGSRRDAALQAGHFNDFVFVTLLRGAILAALQGAGKPGVASTAADMLSWIPCAQAPPKKAKPGRGRGEKLGLSEDELAFYDALETNDSAVKVLGDDTLRTIARELVATVRNNVTIDWTLRENVRAQLRVRVKRILRKYGSPPAKQEKATLTVLEQAAALSDLWAA